MSWAFGGDYPRSTEMDVRRARALRLEMTKAERILWKKLRENAQESGFTFRRQYTIHPYVVDFVCLKVGFVVELDGESHDSRQEFDARRDRYLSNLGYKIMRFTNDDFIKNVDGVVETIFIKARELLLSKER